MDDSRYSGWALTDSIGHAHALLGGVVEKQVEPYGLTRAQAIALGVLSEFPIGISQAEWARLQGVTRQHAYAIAHRLEEDDWIVASKVGRERIVSLSASAQQKIKTLRPILEERLQIAFAKLTETERKRLQVLLEKVVASVGQWH